uniref:Uncharacterized protein n=1 Tax=Cannabis sativa TaxID=3483 RepID=A0A803PL20_CANSA
MSTRKNKHELLTLKEIKKEPCCEITPQMQKYLDDYKRFENEQLVNEWRYLQLQQEFYKTNVWPAQTPRFPEGCRRCRLGYFNGKPVKTGSLCKYCKSHPHGKEF